MSNKTLCLNMIVKNEMANLERCLGSIVEHIGCWVVCDTGSTDGTQDFIKSFFGKRHVPGELHSYPFENFEQARNTALDYAAASLLPYDYLLLADADMELVVEDQGFRKRLEGPGYRLMQRTGSEMSYWNTRLVRRNSGARYHGVTHEYLAVPEGVKNLKGLWYKDHASGSNRTDKSQRDIKLLIAGLKGKPDNVRYWFYLAQCYREAGLTGEAAETYAKRAEMAGWDEEAWQARLQQARCLLKLGDEGGFLRASLAAFNQRPQRAESLYDLARFYRERGMNDASVLFSEPGLTLPLPEDDILFVEGFVYTAGLKEEYAIAAYYSRDPKRKDRGFAACNWLALNRKVPDRSRELAFSNLVFYLRSAHEMMPSFKSSPIGFTPPDGYFPSNPSVARRENDILLVQRTVNYTVEEVGLKYSTPNGAPVPTRNFLLSLTADLNIKSAREIRAPANMPKPCFTRVQGFEDMRLFSWKDQLWCSACVKELTPEGWCEQVLARIDETDNSSCQLTDWRVLTPEGARMHEKNWMPRVKGEVLHFIHTCDPTRVIDEQARTVATTTPLIAAKTFRGGTQAIDFEGGWLALVHQVLRSSSEQRRYYYHRFVWFNRNDNLQAVTRPFFFQSKGIEYAVGLAWHPDAQRLIISYGVGDRESWLATVPAKEVRLLLEDVEQLSFGAAKEFHSLRTSTEQVTADDTIVPS